MMANFAGEAGSRGKKELIFLCHIELFGSEFYITMINIKKI